MFKIILLIATTSAAFLDNPSCAYWCEAPCKAKVTAFYCCSATPSLAGPKNFSSPPCTNLCLRRPGNGPVHKRNCGTEINQLRATRSFKICNNFNDCDPAIHDLCCPDNCVPEKKICVKL